MKRLLQNNFLTSILNKSFNSNNKKFTYIRNFSSFDISESSSSSLNNEKNRKAGIFKEVKVNGPLRRIAGKEFITRQELLKKVWVHIKSKDLQVIFLFHQLFNFF